MSSNKIVNQSIVSNKILSKQKIATAVVLAILIFFAVSIVYYLANLKPEKIITVGGEKIKVTIAKTVTEKAQGLSGRKSLNDNEGMLFVYDNYVIPSFWMKGMEFPIDIIWIKDNMVVGSEKNIAVPQNGEPLQTYQPSNFINLVLEVDAGFTLRHNIKIGDKVEF